MKQFYSHIFALLFCSFNLSSQTFTIGNFVWHDTNGSGVQDPSENGLVTTVTLFNTTTNTVVATTMSNSDGVYIFTNVPPDYYKLHFAAIPGYFRSPTNNTNNPWGELADSDPYQDGWTDEIPLDFNLNSVDAGYTTVLPIKLKSFNAVMSKSISNLSFTTASEINNAGFDIERSSDGVVFERIGWVNGHGSTTDEKHYSFTDPKPLLGINYYRLRQVDYDGRFVYSEVKSIKFESDEISIYPNPVKDLLNLSEINVGRNFQIVDLNHKIIKQGLISSSTIEISALANGLYFIKIGNEGSIKHHRFIKSN